MGIRSGECKREKGIENNIYIYIYILAVPDPALLGFDYFPIYYILIIAIPDS